MTYKDKMLYLQQYRWMIKEEQKLSDDLYTVKYRTIPGSPLLTGMPGGSGGASDMSGVQAAIDELERELTAAINRRIEYRISIERDIERMEAAEERSILRMKYIKCMSFRKIAREMTYSERQTYRIHRAAIQHFEPSGKLKRVQ